MNLPTCCRCAAGTPHRSASLLGSTQSRPRRQQEQLDEQQLDEQQVALGSLLALALLRSLQSLMAGRRPGSSRPGSSRLPGLAGTNRSSCSTCHSSRWEAWARTWRSPWGSACPASLGRCLAIMALGQGWPVCPAALDSWRRRGLWAKQPGAGCWAPWRQARQLLLPGTSTRWQQPSSGPATLPCSSKRCWRPAMHAPLQQRISRLLARPRAAAGRCQEHHRQGQQPGCQLQQRTSSRAAACCPLRA